jgi:hypothetical protein
LEQYPSILGSSKAPLGVPVIAFYKYDGSNLRFEWSPKQGWHKFGTRTQLFAKDDLTFGEGITLFNRFGDEIVERVKKVERGCQRITAFCEYFGPSSFAGIHQAAEPKELRLIDVYLFKRGLMPPRQFVKVFGSMPQAAQVIYEGNLNQQFIDDVRKGKYPVWEGVVCKGEDSRGKPFMVKIKTDAYFKKLNEVYGTQYRLYWE